MDEKMGFLSLTPNYNSHDAEPNGTVYLFNLKEGLWLTWAFDVGFVVPWRDTHTETFMVWEGSQDERFCRHIQENHAGSPVDEAWELLKASWEETEETWQLIITFF